MRDGQNLFAIEADLDMRLILLGKPEPIDLLILPHEVGTLDPERQLLRWMPFDSDHSVVVNIKGNSYRLRGKVGESQSRPSALRNAGGGQDVDG